MSDQTNVVKIYRGLIAIVAAVLLIIAGSNFYRFVTSTTDENLFRTTPSSLYISRPFVIPAGTNENVAAESKPDSVRVGDLVLAINDERVDSLSAFNELFTGLSPGDEVRLRIYFSQNNDVHNLRFRRSAFPDSFLTEIPASVLVFEVTKGGASDLAGLKLGDIIYRINDQPFKNANEADAALRAVESGKTIIYDIIRQNERIVLPVTLARFGLQFSILTMFLAGLVFWGAGAFIAVNRPQIFAARALGLAFIFAGFFIMVLPCQRDTIFDTLSKLRTVVFLASMPLALAFWNHAKFYFPLAQPHIIVNRWLFIWLPYLLCAATAFIFAAMIFAGAGTFVSGQVVYWTSVGTITFLCVAADLVYRKQRDKLYQKIRRPLVWIEISVLALTLITSLWLFYIGALRQIWIAGFLLIIIPLAYLYTIARYQLLEMNLRVRRNVQYNLAMTIWGVALGAVFIAALLWLPGLQLPIPNIKFTGTSFMVMDTPPDPKMLEFWQRFVIIVCALILTFVFWKIGRQGQRVLERLFNRRAYDLSRATSELAEVMATKLGMDELAKGVVERLAKLMELKRVGVMFFRDEKNCCCEEVYGYDGKEWETLCIVSNEQLIKEIQRFRSETRFSIDYLPHGLKEDFITEGFRHIIPIRFKDKLVGTFVIGEKRSESPLHIEDLTFLAAVARQASIAIENAFLHDELTEQERLKHELTIARRIQMASLPQTTPQVAGLDIAGVSIPALEVGGDYFDYLNGVSNGLTVIIGDVSGKGTSAALYMSKVQGIIRSLHAFELSPKELFVRANQLLSKDMEKNSFITAIGALIDTDNHRLTFARAGHLPLFYYQAASDKVSFLTPRGLGLGLNGAVSSFAHELEEHEVHYNPGDIFLFVTDGVTEAQTVNGGEFGEEKLAEILKTNAGLCADGIRDQVMNEVRLFTIDSLPHDDQTVVVVKAV